MLSNSVRTANALSINEIYESIQGEGLLSGTPSVFVRLQGCNLRCPWCDQPEALSFTKEKTSLEHILQQVENSAFKHVVITGGEPMAHPEIGKLVNSLLEEGYSVQIETNGTLWVNSLEPVASRIHITCSPKAVAEYFVHPKVRKHAKELKFIVDEELSSSVLLRKDFVSFLKDGKVVLQPEGNRKDMFHKAIEFQRELSAFGYTLRVIPQMHKLFGVP